MKKRRSRRIYCAVLSFAMLFSLWGGISLSTDEVYAEGGVYSTIMNQALPESYDADDSTNPYTNDDQKFLLAENNELMLYQQWNGEDQWRTIVDNYSNGGSMKIGNGSVTQKAGWASATGSTNEDSETPYLDFQNCVAFDPDGSGRNDHVAFVGWKDGKNCLWVYDTVSGKSTELYEISSSSSIGNCNDTNYLSMQNFFTITAGDYDDDGKDTIVVYNPADKDGFYVEEFKFASESFTKLGSSKRMLHTLYCSDSTLYNETSNLENRLGCNLTTGDFDGDGVDDLGVISYGQCYTVYPATLGIYIGIYKPGNPNVACCTDHRLFTPMIAAVFGEDQDNGSSSWSVISSGKMQTTYAALNKEGGSSYALYDSMRSPTISAGDVDGNGYDELVCSGYQSKVVQYDKTKAFFFNEIDYSNITAAAVSATRTSINISGGTISANEWSKNAARHHSYAAEVQIATQCVAVNGQSAEELVFINGSIYQYAGSGFGKASTASNYFDDDDKYIDSTETAASAITDVVAGVFDGNTQGREQVMFVVAQRQYGAVSGNDVYFSLGAMGGSGYDEDTNIASGYYTSDVAYSLENAGDDNGDYLSFTLAAVDNDKDGLLGSYNSKECIYDDPKVAAVLQGSPYFGDIDSIGGYDDSGDTSYSLTTTYEKGSSTGDEVSFGCGIAADFEFSLKATVEIELRAGYSLNWNKTFEKAAATTFTRSFSAQSQDQVIMRRIPITVYTYDLYKEDGTKQENAYSLAVPGKPVYYQLGIDEFNEFADEYNAMLDKKSSSSDPVKLVKINKNKTDSSGSYDLPADNMGNPQNYFASWAQAGEGAQCLSETPTALSYTTGNSTSEWVTSESVTKSVEMSHGFSFEGSIVAGIGKGDNSAKVGAWASLEYLHSKGSYTTTANETGTSGTVQNINESALVDSGIDRSVIRAYGFLWEFGTWKRELTTESGEFTPFFGYRVWNVTRAPASPTNLAADNSDTDALHSVDLTWDTVSGSQVQGYNAYMLQDGAYKKLNDDIIKTGSYTVSGLDSNTDYTFVVATVAYIDSEKKTTSNSIWSDEASVKTPRQGCKITITADDGADVTVSSEEKTLGENDEVFEGDAVSIRIVPREGYSVVQTVLIKPDGSQQDITSTDGRFSFVVRGDSEVVVITKKIVSEYEFEYASGEHGTIAMVGCAGVPVKSGATVNDNVTLEAEPEDGYILKEWEITTEDGQTQTVAANGSNTYTFVPYSEKHTVKAVFAAKDDPSVIRNITVNTAEGGSLTISDMDGNAYEKTDGKVAVNVGTQVKITAVPDKHYVLKAWTDDLEAVDAETAELTQTVYEDMTVGAEFNAPVKYKLEYESNDTKLGRVKSETKSGTNLVEETDVTLNAVPVDGARLEYWTVNVAGSEEKITTDELKSSYELKLNVTDKTNVTAHFKTLEEYKLTVDSPDTGEVSITNQNSSSLSDGDTIVYGDVLNFTVTPAADYIIRSFTINGENADSGAAATVYGDVAVKAEYARILADNGGKTDSDVNIKLSPTSAKYTGKAIKPAVKVTVGKAVLKAGKDYTVSYKSNIKPGTGYAVVKFKGAYSGKAAKSFKIKENPSLYKADLRQKLKISAKSGKLTVKWGKTSTADGYDVFITKCGTNFSKKPTVTTKKQTVTVSKVKGSKISSKECYKAYIKAYRTVKGKKSYIANGWEIHYAGSSSGYTNAAGITGVPSAKTIKAGKTYALKAKIKKADKNKPLITKDHAAWLRYLSTDSSIAKVSSSGKIKAVSKGKCKIFIITPDGAKKSVKITVK